MSEEIRSAFIDYLDAYFVKRDLEATLAMFSASFTGIGTVIGEVIHNLEECRKFYTRDISEAPNPIYYATSNLVVNSPLSGVGIVSCELNLGTHLLQQEIKLKHLRISMVFVRNGEKWLAEHMHISFPTNDPGDDESYPLMELEEQNKVLHRLVEEKTEKLNDAIREISKLATTDKLTGLFNRLKIEECFTSELLRSQRYKHPFSVILFDLDHFKNINDDFGHLIGDQFLVEFAELISQVTRKTEVLGRWGGDEFIVICPVTTLENAVNNAERIRSRIAAHPFKTTGSSSASFGVSAYIPGESGDALMSRVDAALYEAKKSGGNQVTAR